MRDAIEEKSRNIPLFSPLEIYKRASRCDALHLWLSSILDWANSNQSIAPISRFLFLFFFSCFFSLSFSVNPLHELNLISGVAMKWDLQRGVKMPGKCMCVCFLFAHIFHTFFCVWDSRVKLDGVHVHVPVRVLTQFERFELHGKYDFSHFCGLLADYFSRLFLSSVGFLFLKYYVHRYSSLS